MTAKLIVNVPGRSEKGYARRMLKISEFTQYFNAAGGMTPEYVQKLVEFLTQFTCMEGLEPGQQKDELKIRTEALWDLSEEDFGNIVTALGGVGKEAVVPPPPSAT